MRPPFLPPIAVHEAIERWLAEPGCLRLTGHVRQRMRERHFSVGDIMRVLRVGTVRAVATWDDRARAWKYVVDGRDLDGNPLTLVVVLGDGITVVTGHD